jgi:hypothetical protein
MTACTAFAPSTEILPLARNIHARLLIDGTSTVGFMGHIPQYASKGGIVPHAPAAGWSADRGSVGRDGKNWYLGTKIAIEVKRMSNSSVPVEIQRIQTGVRMERRVLKVLKALAEFKNMSLGDLLEGIVLHAFDGKAPFSIETLGKIAALKSIYELDLDSSASHRLKELP